MHCGFVIDICSGNSLFVLLTFFIPSCHFRTISIITTRKNGVFKQVWMNMCGYYIVTVSSLVEAGRECVILNLTFLYVSKVWLIEMNCKYYDLSWFFFFFCIYFAQGNSSTNVMSLQKPLLKNKDKKICLMFLKFKKNLPIGETWDAGISFIMDRFLVWNNKLLSLWYIIRMK